MSMTAMFNDVDDLARFCAGLAKENVGFEVRPGQAAGYYGSHHPRGAVVKTMIDSTCPRCGAMFSTSGLDVETVREIAASHVCVDGVATVSGEPTTRIVPGPGERLADREVAS